MDRFWLAQYPPGVAPDVDVSTYGSLKALDGQADVQRVLVTLFVLDDEDHAAAFGVGHDHAGSESSGGRGAARLDVKGGFGDRRRATQST